MDPRIQASSFPIPAFSAYLLLLPAAGLAVFEAKNGRVYSCNLILVAAFSVVYLVVLVLGIRHSLLTMSSLRTILGVVVQTALIGIAFIALQMSVLQGTFTAFFFPIALTTSLLMHSDLMNFCRSRIENPDDSVNRGSQQNAAR